MNGAPRARLYTIAPGVPFVDALAQGMVARITAGTPEDPLALARATVLLPTRRAVRSLREAFLRATEGRPVLLPRMMPLGDLDEDEVLIAAEPASGSTLGGGVRDGAAMDELLPALDGLERQMLLARLVMEFGARTWPHPPDAAQAVALAGELARLLDQMETERVGFDALADLCGDDANFARHWQQTLTFLEILTRHWPDQLAARGAISPAERRNRLLARHAAHWAKQPPPGWIVAAGSTGSIPATADLLKTIAGLARGCVVLPGLDRDLAEASFADLPETHAQFGLARLLGHLGVTRDAVRDWAEDWPSPRETAAARARARLLSAAMNPLPAPAPDDAGHALAGVCWLETPSPAEEAAAIALIMRATLEHPEKSCALVTPDRGLARRVAARLRRWDVTVDDSAGRPLAGTPCATFLRLVLEAVAEDFAPLALLACLKHPLAAAGRSRGDFLGQLRRLDRLALRGPRPGPGIDGLRARLARARADAAAQGRDDDVRALDGLGAWLDGWAGCLEPLAGLLAAPRARPRDILAAHVAAAEALAADADKPGPMRLWRGEDGEALASFVADLDRALADGFGPMAAARYPAMFEALMAGRVVRPRVGAHPRLHIWGPLEARLQRADVMILGGLNEGTWPLDPGHDPWMSRPMRRRLGLPLPERRVGLAAHDFAQAFAAPELVLSRARRSGGAPTVPSRWLLRLANVIGAEAVAALKGRGAAWRARARALDRRRAPIAIPRPAPVPPLAVRPRKLSVTEIETWQVNPYAIYARHVLGLVALDPVDQSPGAAERGTMIHEVMERLIRAHPELLASASAAEIEAEILRLGHDAFGPVRGAPGLYAFWWPRFVDIARWVAAHEVARRAAARPLGTECRGELEIQGPAGPFILRGRADRIDELADGRLGVIDFKTGSLPEARDQQQGFAPQLPLLGAMAEAGAFAQLPAREVGALLYWRLIGGDKGGEEQAFKPGQGATIGDAIADARAGLETLIAQFDRKETPYTAYAAPERRPRFDDYLHLARLAEWSSESGEAEGD